MGSSTGQKSGQKPASSLSGRRRSAPRHAKKAKKWPVYSFSDGLYVAGEHNTFGRSMDILTGRIH